MEFIKSVLDNYTVYIPIVTAIIVVIKYVQIAIRKQKAFLEQLAKFQEVLAIALADKYIDNEEIRKIMLELTKCKELGMDTLEAYKEAYEKLVDLIDKFKAKRLKAERRIK